MFTMYIYTDQPTSFFVVCGAEAYTSVQRCRPGSAVGGYTVSPVQTVKHKIGYYHFNISYQHEIKG